MYKALFPDRCFTYITMFFSQHFHFIFEETEAQKSCASHSYCSSNSFLPSIHDWIIIPGPSSSGEGHLIISRQCMIRFN